MQLKVILNPPIFTSFFIKPRRREGYEEDKGGIQHGFGMKAELGIIENFILRV
jgi:hypothetical protein